jgi:ADP-ribosylglycohydrolase
MSMSAETKRRLARARTSLEGLATGDAFGQTFFSPEVYNENPATALATAPWFWTDDTAMALSIYEILEKHGRIDQDELAGSFAARYINDRNRGYGPGMHRLLLSIADDANWRTQSRKQFSDQGSWGNGSAMRVAPVGAYFAEDMQRVAAEAALSAEVTHAHPEGIAGAVALALGAALAAQIGAGHSRPEPRDILLQIAEGTPDSITRDSVRRAALLAPGASVRLAVEALGNGTGLSCQDTVPFALWCAMQHLDSFEDALRLTATGRGDVDTTCAMVGGIVALSGGVDAIPEEWLRRREQLPQWVYVEMSE